MIEILFGNRKVHAVVVASNPLEDQKNISQKTNFQLKKISNVISEVPRVSNNQFKMALWLSRYYYAPLGYCLKTVLPPFFLKRVMKQLFPPKKLRQETVAKKPLILLSNAEKTLTNILPFLKKAVEEQGQVALIVPDTSTIEYFYEALASSYDAIKIYSSLPNKKYMRPGKGLFRSSKYNIGNKANSFYAF